MVEKAKVGKSTQYKVNMNAFSRIQTLISRFEC